MRGAAPKRVVNAGIRGAAPERVANAGANEKPMRGAAPERVANAGRINVNSSSAHSDPRKCLAWFAEGCA
jgi:hypothetical protein